MTHHGLAGIVWISPSNAGQEQTVLLDILQRIEVAVIEWPFGNADRLIQDSYQLCDGGVARSRGKLEVEIPGCFKNALARAGDPFHLVQKCAQRIQRGVAGAAGPPWR